MGAKGENYWLGKYDITREGFIKAGDTQLECRWTGVSSIENAPWPSPVHTRWTLIFPTGKIHIHIPPIQAILDLLPVLPPIKTIPTIKTILFLLAMPLFLLAIPLFLMLSQKIMS